MSGIDQLDGRVVAIGLLIGVLKDSGNRNVSVNSDWFANPVSKLEECPTRISGLLSVLDYSFNVVSGTEYTTLDPGETWYSIFSGVENLPTGLCLVVPKLGSSAGVISLGVFDQLSVDDLTISLYARLPLFYLNDGQAPQFILASGPAQYKNCKIAIEAYSSSGVPLSGDSTFNFMSAEATVDFTDSLDTTFNLSFYENFDPVTGNKTQLPPATEEIIAGSIGALVKQGSYWLTSYIADSSVTIGNLLSAAGLVTEQVDPATHQTTYSFDQAKLDELKASGATAALKNFLITLVKDLLDPMVSEEQPLLALEGGGIYVANDVSTNAYGLRLVIPD